MPATHINITDSAAIAVFADVRVGIFQTPTM